MKKAFTYDYPEDLLKRLKMFIEENSIGGYCGNKTFIVEVVEINPPNLIHYIRVCQQEFTKERQD